MYIRTGIITTSEISPFNSDLDPASPFDIPCNRRFSPLLFRGFRSSQQVLGLAFQRLCKSVLRSRFKVHFAVFQIFVDLSEYKRISLTASAYHNRVTTRHINHSFRILGIFYIAVAGRLPELKPILLLSLLYPNPPFRCKTLPAFCRVSQSPPLRLVL